MICANNRATVVFAEPDEPASRVVTFIMPGRDTTIKGIFEPTANRVTVLESYEMYGGQSYFTISGNIAQFGTFDVTHGERVTLGVKNFNSDYEFDHWQVVSGNAILSDIYNPNATFIMPANDVVIKGHIRLKGSNGHHTISTFVSNPAHGSVVAPAVWEQGKQVSLSAVATSGFEFDRWETGSPGILISNINSATISFLMPNTPVLIRAHFKPVAVAAIEPPVEPPELPPEQPPEQLPVESSDE